MPTENIPHHALAAVRELVLPTNIDRNHELELQVAVESHDINVRDLEAFLSLIDRIYAEFNERGLRNYALRPDIQLRIKAIDAGSITLSFIEDLYKIASSHALISIGVFVAALASVAKQVADAYLSYQQGALISEKRKVRLSAKNNPDVLSRIPEPALDELLVYFRKYLTGNPTKGRRARRFSQEKILKVHLLIRQRGD